MDTMLDFSADAANKGPNEVFVAKRSIPIEPDGSATALFWGAGAAGVAVLVWMLAKRPVDADILPNLLVGLCSLMPCALLFWRKKTTASHFQALQQKINGLASEIDNYIDQQIDILNNVAPLVEKSIDLDKDVMKSVAAFRGGVNITDENRNAVASEVSATYRALVPHMEAYPDLKAHAVIAEAMQKAEHLRKEITAARTLYNDRVTQWNREVFEWPIKRMVAAEEHYRTLVPFAIDAGRKEGAHQVFFN
ncbi:MAG: LemA family protein [Kiritimatiellae bacterium]|nr:LemA family protein [Kiritimatiellia bacterium]